MNLPPTKPTPPPPNPATIKGECTNCSSKERWLFHRVLVRGVDRRLCTSCVLRLHPSCFCPSCFEFYEHPLSTTSSASAHRFISCIKCSSLTHLHCLPSPSPPPSSFLCPPCSIPNFSFFPIPDSNSNSNSNSNSLIDKNLALVLLCASKIASASMAKALGMARARADRTVREAAVARKRAKEALDHCSAVDKVKRVEGSLEVSGSRNLGMGMGTNHHKVVMCKKEDLKNGFIGRGEGNIKEVLPKNNGLSVPVNKIGANGNPKPGNDSKLGNLEQDLERVRSCHGRIVDVSSTT
ncbi:uncharacterized protein LOC133310349 [Gastrolobium bilobum]|uniref:uncharacterized protein LOC133310349 n=1 Tax=Gastrolobium bilobum TaxID=150636 RepID=UPI002AAF9137|nr:uncharacterized protein LOC133310349 [Gastrolobium bilobum]